MLATCKADKVVNRFQEDQDLYTYNAKIETINKIVKEMTSSKQVPKALESTISTSQLASVDKITDLFKELMISQSEALRQVGKDL